MIDVLDRFASESCPHGRQWHDPRRTDDGAVVNCSAVV